MVNAPPNLQSATSPGRTRLAVIEGVIGEALNAYRAGTLDGLLHARPRLARAFARRYLAPVLGTAGEALRGPRAEAEATALWLRWLVSRLRPDHLPARAGIDRQAWIERTGWRPMLAVMCHYGFAPVPEFRDRYHRRPDESAADNLCGLWAVVPSTFYRYLDKGERLLAEWVCHSRPSGAQLLELRELVQHDVYERLGLADEAARSQWHRTQVGSARDAVSALWHCLHAHDLPGFVQTLQRHAIELAAGLETDGIVEAMQEQTSARRERFDLLLALAAVARSRHDEDAEHRCHERALKVAGDDPLMLGIAYAALGRLYETREPDRAFACFEDSARFLREAALQQEGHQQDPAVTEAYLSTLVKLAWLYLLRNDSRARAVLDSAEAMRQRCPVSDDALALLEQTWGEFWRRSGDLQRALEHKHRALNLYERLGDQTALLKTYSNLGLVYGDARNAERAIAYLRKVLDMAARMVVDAEIVANTHLNLGVAHFWQADYSRAIAEYQQALELSTRAGLKLGIWRAHYNLAEACYFRFKQDGNPEDERLGDLHTQAATALSAGLGDAASDEATRKLKREILGPGAERAHDRLLPAETAAHFAEMAEVARQREVLALPSSVQAHVRAHLAVANAYLTIAMKEREAARALIERYALGDGFAAEFECLRATFDRALTREQRLGEHWRRGTGDLLDDPCREALLSRLLQGEPLSKSSYAELCAVGPATASKHLGLLAERGLLVQTGKGPSTRYVLPP